jgi:hypothetical protein
LSAQEAKPETATKEPEVKKAEPAPAPADVPMDKVSYFIGRNFGQQFGSQKIAIDLAALTEGIKSGMEGGKAKYSEQELMAAMQAFEGVMQAKAAEEQKMRTANAGKKKDEGVKFLAENGKKKGVTTTASGLQYEVLKEGTGPKPLATDQVNVHYHGTAEAFIEGFEALDQIGDVFARIHAAGLGAEVGAAAERAVRIDGAAAVASQQRAGAVGVWFEDFAAAGAHAFGGMESLATREQGRVAGDAKMAAAGAHLALAGQGRRSSSA